MKKIIYGLLIGMVALGACRKDIDPVFSESPDQRLKDTLQMYQRELMGAPYGWDLVVFPKLNGAFSFYLKFTDSNRVQMYSDMSTATTTTMKESSWRLKALQQPSILFDTYSYLHELSDPDGNVNGGPNGVGLQSDFEFAFDGKSGDTIRLRGRFNHTYAYLVKAKQEEQDAYNQGKVTRTINKVQSMLTFFQRLSTAESKYDLRMDPDSHNMLVGFMENGKYKLVSSRFYYTLTGVVLKNPYDTLNLPFSKLDNVVWNNGSMTCNVDGKQATITETALPLQVDKGAPMRWYNLALADGSYWQSYNGFHVNGVEDAYNVHATSRFYSIGYWPQYQEDVDLLPWIVVNSAGTGLTFNYGVGFDGPPTVDASGFIHFNIYGQLGTAPSPTTAPLNTVRRMGDADGFYMVQLTDRIFAMVSATDGKSWIFWYR
ncbi:MAG: DUF4302 domain-containing protein [Chitinophaga sp.]|uniref:DUF4302 domain-containing protein n=1 Tax=Chitinophaga sp. TaxID=1869181 RepID=UPI0025C3F5A0|nr:DUF4302 domain-containing protein [Chitinophaga sp.]MBV8253022.1 DUF4302 domain-containing protein [Chitinophaga sp.]